MNVPETVTVVPSQLSGSLVPRKSRLRAVTLGDVARKLGAAMGEDQSAIDEYLIDLRIAQTSQVTVNARLGVLRRLREFLGCDLLAATPASLRAYQASYAHLSPATVDIYTRHVRAFYAWAHGRGIMPSDPAARLVLPILRRGKPHPIKVDDLRTIFAATIGPLRLAYALATFTGLRRGEIVRMEGRDLDLSDPATALIHGKGGRERIAPLLKPVVDELQGAPRRGYVVLDHRGRPFTPNGLSVTSHRHLLGLGFETTLHSMRHSFATQAAKMTRDPLFVRDLLGHSSVATTEIYMDSAMVDAHERLAAWATQGAQMLTQRHLHVVGE